MLARIAYFLEPQARSEIEAVRGVDAEAVLTTLIERRLVRIVERKEAPGRPLLYATTREFLCSRSSVFCTCRVEAVRGSASRKRTTRGFL